MPDEQGLQINQRRMPHWRLEGSVYFSTWCLEKSTPELSMPERMLVANAIKHFAGERYKLLAYCMMDDHLNVIARPLTHSLSQLYHSWKSFYGARNSEPKRQVGTVLGNRKLRQDH